MRCQNYVHSGYDGIVKRIYFIYFFQTLTKKFYCLNKIRKLKTSVAIACSRIEVSQATNKMAFSNIKVASKNNII